MRVSPPVVVWLACLVMQTNPARAADTPDGATAKARAVLARIDGSLVVPGLREPVEVLRDRWGVPHIYARNLDDLFFAQGFVAAQDRLFQIDIWRRIGVGETAEVVGKSGLEADRFARLLRYRGDPEAEWASYGPDARRIANAFTRGINACIDQVQDRLPIEFQILGIKPRKWQPDDVLTRMSGIIMTANFRNEVARAELVAAVGVEKARWVAPVDPRRDYGPVSGLDLSGITKDVLAGYTAATRPLSFALDQGGSNNWVVDGTKSASGKPLLASDPHRPVMLPSLRYLVHLNAPGWNVIGSGEPGLPGVALGHNDHVAWGFTIVTTDQADLYVEETNPKDSTEYKVGDRWEKMTVVKESVSVRGVAPVEVELRFTRHGPVLYQDAKRARAYALKWVGSEPGTAAYLGCLALNQAQSGPDFVKALSAWKSPGENMVYADVAGNVGWVAAGLTPIRKGWDGLLPVPGASGQYEWQGFLPDGDLPQRHKPDTHYVATANHNILPPGYKREISYEWTPRYRFERIRQRLEAQPKFTLEDFKSIQHENTSLPGQALARLVKHTGSTEPAAKLLAEWDGVLTRASKAGPLYAAWLQELQEEFYKPNVPASVLEFVKGRAGVAVLLEALEKPDKRWFGDKPEEARNALLRRTLAAAIQKTTKALGPDPQQWSWGKSHTMTFEHPLAKRDPAYAKAFNLGPVPRSGDGLTPNATSHDAQFRQTAGASYRHLFDLADWDRGLATSTPGQSGQPGSPHYGDLLPLWAEDAYFPLAFSRAKVEEVTRHRLVLRP